MPTYVYRFVDTGETIEVQQGFNDDTLTEYAHPDSGVTMPVKKVFTPVGVTFKGGGFYKTDSRSGSSKSSSGSSNSSSSSSGSSGSDGGSSGSSDSGSSSGSGSSSTAGSTSTSGSTSGSGSGGGSD